MSVVFASRFISAAQQQTTSMQLMSVVLVLLNGAENMPPL
jgi:hypothetical protein